MDCYRRRSNNYWKLIVLQILVTGATGGLGIWVVYDTSIGINDVSTYTLFLGGVFGAVIVSSSYFRKIEVVYDRLPIVFVMVFGGWLIMYISTPRSLAGFALGFGSGILATVAVAEVFFVE